MATITRTYVENNGYASGRATWTVNVTGADVIAKSTLSIPAPSISAKFVSSARAAVSCSINLQIYYPDDSFGPQFEYDLSRLVGDVHYPVSMSSGTTFTIPLDSSSGSSGKTPQSATISKFFNESNPTQRTVPLNGRLYVIDLGTGMDTSAQNSSYWNSKYVTGYYIYWDNIGTITLDEPPTVSGVNGTYTTPHCVGLGTYTTTFNNATATRGGKIQSATLTIGNDSITQNYDATTITNQTLSLIPTTAGTYTPTLTITDTRGQITTKTLSSITVEEVPPPTFDTSGITTNTDNYINNNITTASITINNISSLYDTPTKASFSIGSQVVSYNLNGEDHITLSMDIDQTPGSKIATVRVYDSNNRYREVDKGSVVIIDYVYPSVYVRDCYRINEITKKSDDEGTYALLKLDLRRCNKSNFIKFMSPTILIDGEELQNTILWYTDEDLTQQISWPWLEPPVNSYYNGSAIIYGVLSEFEINKTYSISITPNDNYYSGDTITTTLPQAFFTLDVLAGGHGITFGRSAKKESFDIYMPTNINEGITFNNGIFIDINQNEDLYTLLNSNKLLSKLQVPSVEISMDNDWRVGANHSVVFIITYNNYLHDFEYQPNDFDIIFEELERPKEISIKDIWIDNSVGDNIWLIQKHTYETNSYYNDGVISFKVIYRYKGATLFEETYSKQLIQLP